MKKIAVIGKPANGKSTLSKQLAAATGIEMYALDSILYDNKGNEADRRIYDEAHQKILDSKAWIIEGFGPMNSLESFYKRLDAADTIVYIELPYSTTYWLVAKRCIQGVLQKPEGWPEGSSILKGTLQSFKVIKLCPKFWNLQLQNRLEEIAANKSLHVIRSLSELNSFVEQNVR